MPPPIASAAPDRVLAAIHLIDEDFDVNEMIDALRPVFTGVLMDVADAQGGATQEQVRLIEALGLSLFTLPGDAVLHATPLRPHEVADEVTNPAHRRRLVLMAIIIGFFPHPEAPDQIGRIEDLATALKVTGSEIDEIQIPPARSTELATADFNGRYDRVLNDRDC